MADTDGSFRVRYPAEVRQAASSTSPLLQTAPAGKVVKQMGSAVDVPGVGRRVPLMPRGWIDADALEPMSADPPRGSTTSPGSVPSQAPEPGGEWAARPAPQPGGDWAAQPAGQNGSAVQPPSSEPERKDPARGRRSILEALADDRGLVIGRGPRSGHSPTSAPSNSGWDKRGKDAGGDSAARGAANSDPHDKDSWWSSHDRWHAEGAASSDLHGKDSWWSSHEKGQAEGEAKGSTQSWSAAESAASGREPASRSSKGRAEASLPSGGSFRPERSTLETTSVAKAGGVPAGRDEGKPGPVPPTEPPKSQQQPQWQQPQHPQYPQHYPAGCAWPAWNNVVASQYAAQQAAAWNHEQQARWQALEAEKRHAEMRAAYEQSRANELAARLAELEMKVEGRSSQSSQQTGQQTAKKEERMVGTVRAFSSFSSGERVGWASSPEIRQLYKSDVYIHGSMIHDLSQGDQVSFIVRLNNKGQPQAMTGSVIKLEEARNSEDGIDATVNAPGRVVELPHMSEPSTQPFKADNAGWAEQSNGYSGRDPASVPIGSDNGDDDVQELSDALSAAQLDTSAGWSPAKG
mmetsp:Transcript_24272/g.53945  ORF Transcript_24272/g.53945 Transcript_24272/m.53945 type:complete len:576 (-) Transcript_24272:171-1898(-)